MFAFYMNDTETIRDIFDGFKTEETRTKNVFKRFFTSSEPVRVGVVQVGSLVRTRYRRLIGFVTIYPGKHYKNREEFDKAYKRHRIQPGSQWYCNGCKWGFPVSDPYLLPTPVYLEPVKGCRYFRAVSDELSKFDIVGG